MEHVDRPTERPGRMSVEAEKEKLEGRKYITIPKAGGEQDMGAAGDHKIDLEKGMLFLADGTEKTFGKIEGTWLKNEELSAWRALSTFIYANQTVILFPDESGGGGFTIPANSTFNLRGVPIEKAIIRTSIANTKVRIMMSVFKEALLSFEEITPSTLSTGGVAVLITATRLSSTSIPAKSVSVVADSTNALSVYVGDSTVAVAGSTRGVEITPGGSHDMDIDDVNKIYAIAAALGNNVMFMRLI